MDILGKILGNPYRVKLIRLFVFNPGEVFDKKSIVTRAKIPLAKITKELNLLTTVGLIKNKKNIKGWELVVNFPLLNQFKLLLNADFLRRRKELVKRFKNCGRVRLFIISGVFVQNTDCLIDLVIVGDKLNRPVIENIIRGIEAEVGKELVYSIMDTEDFMYRYNSSDKFIRDIFDYPHERIIDKLPI